MFKSKHAIIFDDERQSRNNNQKKIYIFWLNGKKRERRGLTCISLKVEFQVYLHTEMIKNTNSCVSVCVMMKRERDSSMV